MSTSFKVACVVCVIGVVLFVVGIVLLVVGISKTECESPSKIPTATKDDTRCEASDEAKRVGFTEFIAKVRTTYFELQPHFVYQDPEIWQNTDFEEASDSVRARYFAYNTEPSVLKNRTDGAWRLLDKLNALGIAPDFLKPRERKALMQVKHSLSQVFGQPYESNYYTGDWMLGPDLFCWRTICQMGYDLSNIVRYLKPRTLGDVDVIKDKLKTHKLVTDQYVKNMKMGVLKGMVRNIEACQGGVHALKRAYLNISLFNETGVFKEWYTQKLLSPEFYSNISTAMNEEWKNKHNGLTVKESVKEYLLEYFGKPVFKFIRYFEDDHLHHCVPSSVSSGLATLPLKYVYVDGKANTSWPTDPTLPLTNKKLNGKKSYEHTMAYFTTNTMTPTEVHELGYKMLNKLYPEAVQIAREVTNIYNNNDTAVEDFRKKINDSDMYFNDEPIPRNESDNEAFRKCSDLKGAERFCPKRWEAIQKWFKEARKAMSLLDPKTVRLFHFAGSEHTTPNCPLDLVPDLNPSSGIQSYQSSDKNCSTTAFYRIPFFLGRLGPRYSEWSISAHETRPGHHTQVQGNTEHFQDSCGGPIGWLDSSSQYSAFTEGWALYAENPLIADDTDTYNNEPMQKYGMLKWQIWRAIRLIVDTGLHYTNMTRAEALKLFDEKAWDDTDFAIKELDRYQSIPGQATSYMVGQLDIMKSRQHALETLGSDFDIKEFHYQVLSQGSSPLAYLSDHIRRYVVCKKDATEPGCSDILNPPTKKTTAVESTIAQDFIIRPERRHYA